MSTCKLDSAATQLLLALPGVEDGAALRRSTVAGSEEIVAYVVPSGPFLDENTQADAEQALAMTGLPVCCVGVSVLPARSDGSIDVDRLASLPVVDSQAAEAAEVALRATPGVAEAVAFVTDSSRVTKHLSLSEIVPGSVTTAEDPKLASSEAAPVPSVDSAEQPGAPSVSDGGPLRSDLPANLWNVLLSAAREHPGHGITYVRHDGSEVRQTYPELLARAQSVLRGLRGEGLAPGDFVVFQLDKKDEFIAGFWACALGGFIPAPIAVPVTYQDYNAVCSKLHGCWLALHKPVILTRTALAGDIRGLSRFESDFADARICCFEDLADDAPDHEFHVSRLEDLALVLFTSGSTGRPKGVTLSHKNVLARSLGTAEMNAFDSRDISLNWFPLDHVGGIVMFHVMYTAMGADQIEAPPEWVLEQPLRWLDLAEKHRVTVTWAPNFAFGLINGERDKIRERRWDLSRLRFILNGGEAVVPSTALRFLELLAPFDLPSTAMRPAWGMSETSSGVLFSDRCKPDDYLPKDQFVEVGPPIPGVSARIVDASDQPVTQSRIGRLQVYGLTVTGGYFDNPELNSESFSSDGWFNTGDLAYMREGRVTITGRSKDVIIVRGVNYYCHELEALVESAPGVAVSFTAATPVLVEGADTDAFCIFFSPQDANPEALPRLIDDIRSTITKNTGLAPACIVPLSQDQIPKTAIGKIQRTELRTRLERGEFDGIIRQLERARGKGDGIPDWFYRRAWKPKHARSSGTDVTLGTCLVFADGDGLASSLLAQVDFGAAHIITVVPGTEFLRESESLYRLSPSVPEHYGRLLDSLKQGGTSLDTVLHCWTYGSLPTQPPSVAGIRQGQYLGTYGLLSLVQAFERSGLRPRRLLVATSHSQPVLEDDRLAPERSTAAAFCVTLALEADWLTCRHIDLQDDPPRAAECLAREMRIRDSAAEVAYRGGVRLEPYLEHVDMLGRPAELLPIVDGGLYLITGGLGGIGAEIVRFLMEKHHIKALVVGSTELPPRGEWDVLSRTEDKVADRIRNYRQIEAAGGSFCYRAVDLSDASRLGELVSETESMWGKPLAGILHLAGAGNLKRHWRTMDQYWIRNHSLDTFEWMFQPKVYGTHCLFELLAARPGALFIAFSSVNSLFGGATFSAYSAANRFLDVCCIQKRRELGSRVHCLNWTMWDDLGMSAGAPAFGRQTARDLGYHIIEKQYGLYSLLAAMCRVEGQLIIGLDGTNPQIRKRVANDCYVLRQLSPAYTQESPHSPVTRVSVTDRFGVTSTWPCMRVSAEEFRSGASSCELGRQTVVEPRTKLEETVAQIWRDVLSVARLSVTDRFFDLGGDSLLAMRLVNRLREVCGVGISLRVLFEQPTVESLSAAIAEMQPPTSATAPVEDTPAAGKDVGSMSDEDVDALLTKMVATGGNTR